MKFETEIQTLGYCKAAIPVEALAFQREENQRRKGTPELRLLSKEEIIFALIEAGLIAGNWKDIALRNSEQVTPLKARARQYPKGKRPKS